MPVKSKKPQRRKRPLAKLPDGLQRFTINGTAGDWSNLQAAAGDESSKVPTCKMTAYTGDIMRPQLTGIGYFGRGVVLDLKGWKFQPGQSAINWQHNRSEPVGHIDKSTVTAKTVECDCTLSIPGEYRDKIVEGAAAGYVWRVSVEGSPDTSQEGNVEYIEDGAVIKVNGRRLVGPLLLLRAGTFTGVGFVTTAGDSGATAQVSASLSSLGTESDPMTFIAFLAACGLAEANVTAEQRVTLQAAYDAQYVEAEADDENPETDIKAGDPPKKTPPLKVAPPVKIDAVGEQNKQLAANLSRVNKITALCAKANNPEIEIDGKKVDLSAHAIETGMDAKDVELEIYRGSAPRGPAIHSHAGGDVVNPNAMILATLLSAGLPIDSPVFRDPAAIGMGIPSSLRAGLNDESRQRALEAAHKYGSVSLQGLARDALALEGKAVPRDVNGLLEAASSSAGLNQVYRATVGAALLLGFREAARTLDMWSGTDETDDFKEVQRWSEDTAEPLAFLPNGGEADHTTMGAKYETLSVDQYARQAEIGYKDYRNNNLGMIARLPFKMGQSAYRTEENLGYAVLMSNPTMKSTTRPLFNSTDGTDYGSKPLTHDNADFAIAAMSSMTDGDATLDLMPKFALLPPQLLTKGRQIYRSPVIGEDGGQGTVNAVAQYGVQPLGAARLGNGTTHPKTKQFQTGSQTTHYLLADGVEIAARVYLSGNNRAPMVRVSQLTQGRWGTHIDVLHIFGFGFLTTKGIMRLRSEA